MTEKQKIELLEYCGFIRKKYATWFQWYNPGGKLRGTTQPKIDLRFLFEKFVPAWNKKNPGMIITSVHFVPGKRGKIYFGDYEVESEGKTEAETMAKVCLKLMGEK